MSQCRCLGYGAALDGVSRSREPTVCYEPKGAGVSVAPPARTSVHTGTGSAADVTRPAVSGNRTNSLPGVAFPTVPSRMPIFYNYSMKVKNYSVKVIEGIAWDYIFIDPKS